MDLIGLAAAAVDLILPTDCPGCSSPADLVGPRRGPGGLCPACAGEWRVDPAEARPSPAPSGLPSCLSAGGYEGLLRAAVLAYKDGRRTLSGLLGDALAAVVAAGATANARSWPLVLVPVPSTAKANRQRSGDHMLRLARRAGWRLRRDGWRAEVLRPMRARPKADSGHLSGAERAVAVLDAFRARPGQLPRLRAAAADGIVVVLDDVLTTGNTVAAFARQLQECAAPVAFAATLAATRLRTPDRIGIVAERSWDQGDEMARRD